MEMKEEQWGQQKTNLSREGSAAQPQGQSHGELKCAIVLGLIGSEPSVWGMELASWQYLSVLYLHRSEKNQKAGSNPRKKSWKRQEVKVPADWGFGAASSPRGIWYGPGK